MVDATYKSGRRAAIVELVERVDDAGRLRPDWSRDRAVASLMVLTSLEAIDTLVESDGWDVNDAGSLLAEMAAAAVLGA